MPRPALLLAVAGATGTVGRHVVAEARRRGHRVAPLSRAGGQDLVTGEGVAAALAGADAVIDVSGVGATRAAASVAFFTAATETLLAAEREAAGGHHVALSIVGIDAVDAGYYAGKLAQERVVRDSGRPWSVLRAAQFHEFAEQVAGLGRVGPVTLVPRILSRPVAAREVGAALVDAAEHGPAGRLPDLVGPADDDVASMIRRMLRDDGSRRPVLEIAPPGRYWRASRSGVLRGGADARRGRIDFATWLASGDHTPVTSPAAG